MKTLPEHIQPIFDFEKGQDPAGYEERVGPPTELPATIGRITMNFQYLEDILSEKIVQMTGLDSEIGEILTCELSFKNKVNLFSSLLHKLKETHSFNFYPGYEEIHKKELIKALFKCEELRNQILHSSMVENYRTKQIVRTKTTSKAKRGLTKIHQEVDIPYLFNVADYIGGIEFELDQFFIEFKKNTT